MKTRAKKPAALKSPSQSRDDSKPTSKHTWEPNDGNPPRIFILPKDRSADARIISLPHPATSKPHRYFVDPEHGFYEFTRVAAPKKACRSWLLAPEQERQDDGEDGYVCQSPDMFVATPIDALFLLLPALCKGEQDWASFHDRLFENEAGGHEHLRSVLHAENGDKLAERMEQRMRHVCDVIEMGEDSTYKINVDKLALVLFERAKRIVEAGLPASMEERFVKSKLEMPELSMRREESSVSMVEESSDAVTGADEADSQVDNKRVVQKEKVTVESKPAPSEPQHSEITNLLRLRTALTYLTTNYIPPQLSQRLHSYFASHTDFTPLDTHLAHISKLKSEAQALRSISDNISRKRGVLDDEEALEKADAKKRKKEEDEAKKKSMSQGVKKLMKADTSGMKKLSSFFGKGPAKK